MKDIDKKIIKMKDIDKIICSKIYNCCKENREFISTQLVSMGGYKTYNEFLEDISKSPDIALWALCHILDGLADENFIKQMQYEWVEQEIVSAIEYDVVYKVKDGDEYKYFRIGCDVEFTHRFFSIEVKKVTKTVTVFE